MGARASFTHVALRVRDVDASIGFYHRYAGLLTVHDRVDNDTRVVWLAEVEKDPQFVFVLMGLPANACERPQPMDHLGFAVASREEVDRLGELARQDDTLVLAPVDAGPIVGYICEAADPDGNVCEFSFGQPINPRHLPQNR